jgi:4-amino-4-deoxy-L-arabinose transferase-like glycosyltransferase
MVLPLALALFCFLLARKKDSRILYFTAGLLSGLAFMIKQVAAFNFLVLLAFAIVEVKRPHPLTPSPIGRGRIPICNPFRLTWVRAFVVLLSGFFIIPAIFIIYFWLNGAGWDFINCVFFINQVYLAASPAPFFFLDPRYGWDIIRAQMTKENGILWLLSLASLFVIFLKDRKNELLLIAVWGLASFLGVSAGTLFFGHYFIQLIPAFCLLSAYALIKIKDEASFAARVILAILIGFVLLLNFQYQYPFYVKYNPYQINEMKYGTKTFGIARFAALDLSSRMSPNDDIFVWSAEPEIYFYLNRRAPGKYTYYFNWMKNLNIAGRILMDAKKQNPRFILWTDYAPSFPELEKWIKDDYTLREKHFNWILFERKK